jgi:hypothetical protein
MNMNYRRIFILKLIKSYFNEKIIEIKIIHSM